MCFASFWPYPLQAIINILEKKENERKKVTEKGRLIFLGSVIILHHRTAENLDWQSFIPSVTMWWLFTLYGALFKYSDKSIFNYSEESKWAIHEFIWTKFFRPKKQKVRMSRVTGVAWEDSVGCSRRSAQKKISGGLVIKGSARTDLIFIVRWEKNGEFWRWIIWFCFLFNKIKLGAMWRTDYRELSLGSQETSKEALEIT